MDRSSFVPYEPLNQLKPFANDVWIADGPEISMRLGPVSMPFPTRMTVVKLPDGSLWVHSPIAWNEALAAQLRELGSVRHLIAPNSMHYWYLPDWQAHFREATSYGPPGLEASAKRPLRIDVTLGEAPPDAWQDMFELCLFPGRIMTEVDFHHRPSSTLILADLIENFEPARVKRPLLRGLLRFAGVTDPHGKAPFDMRLNFRGHRDAVRASGRKLIDWRPERVVLAHGRCLTVNAAEAVRRAFAWTQ